MKSGNAEYRNLLLIFSLLTPSQADERNMNQQITQLKSEIERYEVEIRKITESQGEAQTKRQQMQQQLEAATEECTKTKSLLDEARNTTAQLTQRLDEAIKNGRNLDTTEARSRSEVESASNNIAECHRFSRDQLGLFGKSLQEVIRMVQGERWVGQAPIGPLGLYVTLKESRWAPIMRVQLGGMMSSWAVTDNRDRQKLKNILERTGK